MDDFGDTARDSVDGGNGLPSAAVCVSSGGILSMELRPDDGVDVVEVESMSKAVLLGETISSGSACLQNASFPRPNRFEGDGGMLS